MPRRVQDIVPGSNRSIRNIPVERPLVDERVHTARGRMPADTEPHVHVAKGGIPKGMHKVSITKVHTEPGLVEPPPRTHKPRNNTFRWLFVTVGIIVIVAGVGFIASTYFSRATFTIIPKTFPVAVGGTYVAQFTMIPNSAADALTYEIVTIRATATSTITASDGPSTVTKAEGKVTIYNTYSDTSQRLVAGTRLANSSGKVYRLTSTVDVPGYGANKTPGTLTTDVVADEAGQSYNLAKGEAPDDFKIVAYQGTERYSGFYAKVSSDIAGGYSGSKKTVNQAVLASTTATLKEELTTSLKAQAEKAIPEGYVMYDNVNTLSFSESAVSGMDKDKADITVKAVINGIIFKKSALAAKLAGSQAVASFGKFSYSTPGLETLTLTIANPKDFSAERRTSLLIRASGNFSVTGIIPTEEIKAKLAGVPLAHSQEILQGYGPVIKSGSGELVPPWAKVPTDPERISVVVKEDI